jgi:hypothetical protein
MLREIMIRIVLMFGLTGVLLTACSDTTSVESIDVDAMIEEVRTATQSYSNIENAKAAGWSVAMSPCVEHPAEGGMGYHYARMDYIDGRVNHLEPQILLYEPLQGGELGFVGVEYIIPFDILPADAESPELFGEHFHQNHDLGIWALHVWTEKENPKGMFYDWNPNVSCEYEVDVMLNEVRAVTEPYHDIETAMDAGWDTFLSPCVEHPELGGMGYHVGRMKYMDGRTSHLEPQVLLYEPTESGGMELVGVEYIIPFEVHSAESDPPMTLGQHYHQNPVQEIWALHVWTEKENPAGIFSDWNPNVSCQHAEDE